LQGYACGAAEPGDDAAQRLIVVAAASCTPWPGRLTAAYCLRIAQALGALNHTRKHA